MSDFIMYLLINSPFMFLFIFTAWWAIKEQTKRIDAELKWQAYEREYTKSLKYVHFVRHIQSHLEKGQHVICKICGRSVDDIYESVAAAKGEE